MSVFDQFTNKYSLSKTLRFELKPVGRTLEMLEENNVFNNDRAIRDKYIKTKPFFDTLHREFIQMGLEGFAFSDLSQYEATLKKFVGDRKSKTLKKDVESKEAILRMEVIDALNAQAKIWATKRYPGLKNKNIGFLSEEGVFEKVLLPRYGQNEGGTYKEGTTEVIERVDKKTGTVTREEISIFEGWKGFTGYFKKFFETRANFYKTDGKATAIATRITDNLRRCFENRWILEAYPQEFVETLPEKYCDVIKNVENFGSFVLQGKKGNEDANNLGTGIDGYNQIIGHIKKEANLFRQKTKTKIQHLKTLDKQILSPKEKFIDEIDNEEQLKRELEELLRTGNTSVTVLKKLFEDFVNNNSAFDLTRIYFTKKGFETLSRKYSTDVKLWEEKLLEVFKENKDKSAKYDKKQEKYTFPNFIKVAYIQASLEKIATGFDGHAVFWKEKYHQENTKADNVWQQFLHIFLQEFLELLVSMNSGREQGYEISAQNLQEELRKDKLKKTEELTAVIKPFADHLLSIYQFAKYFSLDYKNRWNVDFLETDDVFYERYYSNFFAEAYEKIVQPYNRLRNYLTKKPWEEVQKWKLNFGNPALAKGWDKNKETDNTAVILRKNGDYFLGVMKKSGGANKMFDDKHKKNFEGEGYEKMEYKQISDASKDIQNLIAINGKTVRKTGGKGDLKWNNFCSKNNVPIDSLGDFEGENKMLEYFKNKYLPREINEIRVQKKYLKSSESFNIKDLHKFIDYYKERLVYFDFDFTLKNTNQYEDFLQFTNDLSNQGYKISWQSLSEQYIDEKNQSGELYLFQIKNRDWNVGKKEGGMKNVHTMYFENIFSEENELRNFIVKLNGEAELFHRPKSIEKVEERRNFTRDIIAKKRYTEDKSFFHVPITINRTSGDKTPFQFNQDINILLAKNPNVNILGIDRGEKHLVYYSLIDQEGNILESNSLNVINGKNYHWELEKRAKNREQQRKDWKKVEEIKDLKRGYISQVVHKIARLAIENNAIIVFEDLNMRFKQVRGGVEKSTYQQLEKALLDKLNFCVDKTKKSDEIGGVLRAHQLTAPVEAFKDMGKQTGVIFYTTAAYTSQVDPVSGWRPHVYLRYENIQSTSRLIKEKFDAIEWNNAEQRFEFVYTYEGKQWRVCSNVERWRSYRSEGNNNQWDYKKFPATGEGSITENLKNVFAAEKIDLSQNIIKQISETSSKKLLEEIIFYFRLICQIRNTDGELHKELHALKEAGNFDCQDQKTAQKISAEDFILSPVEPFFDSRKAGQFDKNLPENGDANGAYNIARKGVLILEKINTWSKSENREKTNPEVFIKNEEWDAFIVENRTRR